MSSTFNHDKELAEFFTDVEHLRDWFKNAVAAPELAKRILVIHGVGGVGKSSLLRMFRLHCKSVNVPVALASGDEAKSALDVLTRWTDDLKADGVAFPAFGKTHEHYRAIQAKVDGEAQKSRGKMADLAGKAAGKTAETAAAAAAGAALGSIIPGIGTIVGALGGMGAEALVDWLRGFLTKPDIDLLLDPAKKLTDDFLADVAATADKRRIVVMLDTFEQMSALDDWAREVAQRVGQVANLSHGVLLVIAGRALPNWSRTWDGFIANAQIEELKPMTEEVMRELIQRYYATMRGGEPNPTQVDAIIRFARGLPMVVTSAVQLWVKYGVEDFESVKPEIVANLVDRLMEGVPSALIPALEAAAVVRWFDQPILRAVMKRDDVRDVYNELRRFPFVRTRVEGLALHDAVREIMDENLRAQDSERHCELHERAATYFEKRLEKVTGEEVERLGLERLYHRVRADEETGIKLFQETAEELLQYRLVNRLHALLNDANTYALEREDSRLRRDYYMACLLDQEGRWFLAEDLLKSIAQNPNAQDQVRSYALRLWGAYLARPERISKAGGTERAIEVLQSSAKMSHGYDAHTILAIWELGLIYERLCQWDKAWHYFNILNGYALSLGKSYQSAFFRSLIKDPYAKTGNWRELLNLQKELGVLLDELPIPSDTKVSILSVWAVAFAWMGRYAEGERIHRDALKVSSKSGAETSGIHRDLGFSLAFQDRFDEAHYEFQKSMGESKEWVARRANFDLDRTMLLHYSFWGAVHLRAGELHQARRKFLCAVWLKRKHKDNIGFPELFVGLGTVFELLSDLLTAQKWYSRCIELWWTGRLNFVCGALSGLVRVKHAQGDYAAIPPLLAEAEQLAQQYEYNDHLASLRLTQGMLAWEGRGDVVTPTQQGEMTSPLQRYQHALIYALRYNRFLLDEVLSGRPQGTPLRPLIPYCLERGEEGRQMLIALRDWWKTSVNDIGTPRSDTISPIPEGIALLEAERIAREREPGDGSPQKSVVEQIDAVLQRGSLASF